jgi:hypothetical protein
MKALQGTFLYLSEYYSMVTGKRKEKRISPLQMLTIAGSDGKLIFIADMRLFPQCTI